MEVMVLERSLYDVPDYPSPPAIHHHKFIPSPPHIPLASTAPQWITKLGLAVTSH